MTLKKNTIRHRLKKLTVTRVLWHSFLAFLIPSVYCFFVINNLHLHIIAYTFIISYVKSFIGITTKTYENVTDPFYIPISDFRNMY